VSDIVREEERGREERTKGRGRLKTDMRSMERVTDWGMEGRENNIESRRWGKEKGWRAVKRKIK